MKTHQYTTQFNWTGNLGKGTVKYDSYSRDYDIKVDGKTDIKGSSDPAFRGDPSRHNPEDLFLSSVSSCHALWYLHLCSVNKIVVLAYEDIAKGVMSEAEDGSGKFIEIILYPKVTIVDHANIELAKQLHENANKMCFIANSLNINVGHKAKIMIA